MECIQVPSSAHPSAKTFWQSNFGKEVLSHSLPLVCKSVSLQNNSEPWEIFANGVRKDLKSLNQTELLESFNKYNAGSFQRLDLFVRLIWMHRLRVGRRNRRQRQESRCL